MYAEASKTVMTTERILLALVNSDRSSGLLMSMFTIFDPAKTCRIKPAVTMGPIPSSISVPRFEAKITLSEPRGSFSPALPIP